MLPDVFPPIPNAWGKKGWATALVNKQAAAHLRSIAGRLEKYGFAEIKDENGNVIGKVYADYAEMFTN
jgi:hypothetical protein